MSDETSAESSSPPRSSPSRGLPIGPVGLLAITAVAIAAAFGAARLFLAVADDDDDVVSVEEALSEAAEAPLVTDIEARAEIGGPAPNVRLEYLDGGVQDLAEVAGVGTPVVLNFWSSTCAPCLKEMPAFQEVSEELDDSVVFVGVDVTDTEEAGKRMVRQTGVTFRNAHDPGSEIFAVFGGVSLPRTVLIDGDGTVVATHSGGLEADELRALLGENDLI